MPYQRFAFANPPSLGGGLSGSMGNYGSWPPPGLPGGDLTAALSGLLTLLQIQPASPTASRAPAGSTQPGMGDAPVMTPDDERRASDAFLRDITASSLRRLFRYLESAAPRHADVAACYQPFHQAVQAFRVRDYGQALTFIHRVYRMITALRSRHLDLPEVSDETAALGETVPARAAQA